MKTIFAAFIALSVASVAAQAENAERATFQPLPLSASAEKPIDDNATGAAPRRNANLAPIELSQVDRNRDGEISFTELLVQDIFSDF